MLAALFAPLDDLRDQYESALTTIRSLVEDLAALRAQAGGIGPPTAGESGNPPGVSAANSTPEARSTTESRLPGRASSGNFERLLELQQRLSELEGFAGVVVTGVEHGKVTLLVDLDQPSGLNAEPGDPPEAESSAPPPTLVCAWCDSVLSVGGRQISHGLCAACAQPFMLDKQRGSP